MIGNAERHRSCACRLLAAAILVFAGSADGGGRTIAPVAPTVSDPPILVTDGPSRLRRAMNRGQSRRAMVGYASRLAADPRSMAAAIGLVHAARRAGRGAWAGEFLAALGRRWDVAAIQLARAEHAYLQGQVEAGWRRARAARLRRPGHPVAVLAEAAGRLGLGDLQGTISALGELSPVAAGGPEAVGNSLLLVLHEDRWARLALVFDRTGAGAHRQRRAWRRAVRSGDPYLQARALLLAAATDGAAGRPDAGSRAAARARELAVRLGDGVTTSLAISTGGDLEDPESYGPDGRRWLDASCDLLPATARYLRGDCRLARLDRRWRAGDLSAALRLLDEIAPTTPDRLDRLTLLRVADTAISLLQVTGEVERARRWAEAAVSAAARLSTTAPLHHFSARRAALGRLAPAGTATGSIPGRAPEGMGDLPATDSTSTGSHGIHGAWARGDPWAATGRLSRLFGEESSSRFRPAVPALPEGRVGIVVDALLDARVHTEAGRHEAARHALRDAAEQLARWIGDLGDPALRAAVVEVWSDLHRRVARADLGAERPGAALMALDVARRLDATGSGSRLEADGLPPTSTSSVDPADGAAESLAGISRLLTDDLAILSYGFLGPDLWGWVVRRDRTVARRLPVEPDEVEEMVGLWRTLTIRNAAAKRRRLLGRRLARVLISPLVATGALEGVESVVVVPDGALHGLPLAALPPDERGERLYGDLFVWARAPSLRQLERSWRNPPRSGPVAAFGSSGGPRTGLELLRAADPPRGRIFRAARATETRFRRMAERAAVIHVAGHAIPSRLPYRGGGLALRGDLHSDGLLTAREILDLHLDGAVVVLLGCDTASRPPGTGEGALAGVPSSLGEAFLEAGARAVIGNLWETDETASQAMADRLYALGGPQAGPGSLASARRRVRQRWPDRPGRWAGTVWIGSPAASPPSTRLRDDLR